MEKFFGTAASDGIAIGKIFYFRKQGSFFKKRSSLDAFQEKERFHSARIQAIQELHKICQRVRCDVGESAAMVFDVHAAMLEDLDYIEFAEDLMSSENYTAEYTVEQADKNFQQLFEIMDDEYMKARASDVADISNRLLRILSNAADSNLDNIIGKVILACDDLLPSETVQLDKSKILGFAARKGSRNSHVAILARSLGIPNVVSLGIDLELYNHKTAVLDGNSGVLLVEPDESTLKSYKKMIDDHQKEAEKLSAMIDQPNRTLDGISIEINGNIGHPEECELVKQNGGWGIGLFRSEFLYMENDHFPTEDEQFAAYKKVLQAMNHNRVIIRTLDFGADKKVPYFHLEAEENPALGFRAIRISLAQQEIFKTQLRALLRSSIYGRLAIMFPMIISLEEVKNVKKIVAESKSQLEKEGIAVADNIELGIMIETPAAAMISDLLADEVDFFSFGTNDLTQYTLAVDRMNSKVGHLFDSGHLGVLRLMKFAADMVHKRGKWVGICGESAADINLLPIYLSMGIDELSVAPSAILKLRSAMQDLDIRKVSYNLDFPSR